MSVMPTEWKPQGGWKRAELQGEVGRNARDSENRWDSGSGGERAPGTSRARCASGWKLFLPREGGIENLHPKRELGEEGREKRGAKRLFPGLVPRGLPERRK